MSFMHTRAAIAAPILARALASSVPAAAKAAPSTPKCGDTLTHSVKLHSDLTDCPADGLVIGAAGVTVDLNGHTIDGTVTRVTDCDVAPFGAAGIRTPATASSCCSAPTGTVVRENHVARNGNDIVILDASSNTVTRNSATDTLSCPDCFGPTGFGIAVAGGADDNVVSANVVERTQQDGIRIADLDPGDPANPVPNRTQVRGNIVRGAGADGVLVDAAAEGTVLEHNYALDAGDDGIHVDSAASALTGNRAFFNHDLGIEAVPGVTDGGGNRARQNGNPAQCSGVACR